MEGSLKIAGAALLSRNRNGQGLTIISEKDHVLRRFGAVRVNSLTTGEILELVVGDSADLILYTLSGKILLRLTDYRKQSPSSGVKISLEMSALNPQSVLIPFGVNTQVEAIDDVQIIVIATHDQ